MNKFKTPFRLGKKQNRAVLDADGHQVVVFNKGLEYLAEEYVNLINNNYERTISFKKNIYVSQGKRI